MAVNCVDPSENSIWGTPQVVGGALVNYLCEQRGCVIFMLPFLSLWTAEERINVEMVLRFLATLCT